MTNINDIDLIIGLKQEKSDAQEQLLLKYSDDLIRFIMSAFQTTQQDAEDIAVEALYKAVLKIDKFKYDTEKPRGFRNWLFQIAKNIFFDRKRLELELSPLEDEILLYHEDVHNLSDMDSEQVNAVQDALKTLPDNQRETLILYYSGWKLVEIANHLNVPAGTIRQWKSRGLKAVTELLTKHPAIQEMLHRNEVTMGETE